jgi:hypothetical protein
VKRVALFEVSVWQRSLRQKFFGLEPREQRDSSSVINRKFIGIHETEARYVHL